MQYEDGKKMVSVMSFPIWTTALLFLIYGLVKVSLSIVLFVGEFDVREREKLRSRYPVLRTIITNDVSVAGLMADVALFIFGIYSLFHAFIEFNRFGMLPQFLRKSAEVSQKIVHSGAMTFFITWFIGYFLVIMYTLALLWSQLNPNGEAPKWLIDPNNRADYAMFWAFGWSFLGAGMLLKYGNGWYTNMFNLSGLAIYLLFSYYQLATPQQREISANYADRFFEGYGPNFGLLFASMTTLTTGTAKPQGVTLPKM
jgi:hypothetical protein